MQINNYYVKHLFKVKLFSLKSYIKSLEKNKSIDFIKCKSRFENDLRLMIKYLEDINIYTYNCMLGEISKLRSMLDSIRDNNTIEELLRTIDSYKDMLEELDPERIIYNTTTRHILDRNYSSESNELEAEIINEICKPIKADNHIKIFDPQCGNGDNISNLTKALNSECETYGLDEEKYGIYDAKKKMNKTIIGTLRGSKISNEVFDVLFLKPRPQAELEYNFNQTIKEANEKTMLKQTYRFLKPKGLLIYTIPFYRMYNDMWYFITKNFTDITVVAHKETEEKLITIYAIKNTNPRYSEIFNSVLNASFESLPVHCNKEYIINSNPELEVQLFRGSVIDVYELTDMIDNDGLYNEFYKSFNSDKQKKDTSPLLPFNLGQIGLILTSGELDGVVEEIPGVNHVIKGMTVKTVESEEIRDSQNDTVTCKNTISNMVQLNAFTADGDFISIN